MDTRSPRVDKTTRATVHTSPAGRQLTHILTPENRIRRTEVPAILPIELTYMPAVA